MNILDHTNVFSPFLQTVTIQEKMKNERERTAFARRMAFGED
jgi:hypothetical protein